LEEIYNKEGSVCYESAMLNKWCALAGENNNGPRAGEVRTIKNSDFGSLALLSLVTPMDEEKNRRIFALFIIDDYFEGGFTEDGYEQAGYVACNSDYKLNFTRAETNDLRFWDYYSNENATDCRWGSGLFRYLSDERAAQILKQAVKVKRGTEDEALALNILEYFCKAHRINMDMIPEPSGSKIK